MEQTTFQYTYPADYGKMVAIDTALVQNVKEAHMRFPTLLAKLRKEAEAEARQARRHWDWRAWLYRWYNIALSPTYGYREANTGDWHPLREYWYRQLRKEYPA